MLALDSRSLMSTYTADLAKIENQQMYSYNFIHVSTMTLIEVSKVMDNLRDYFVLIICCFHLFDVLSTEEVHLLLG